ncbi:cysteine-rich venom protein 1-like [Photinus pyralis]|uniref:cysteine-rich venom protein 1-like n=1 Tax=Photinus pyralis TaxID=7054 RepID=UPI0012676E5E|nr:cysteine-rich venom protein 1-like [Photinus pyralis]XP_031330710.1 cysteine-rich venom protein 1-like [Photinus pyralis]
MSPIIALCLALCFVQATLAADQKCEANAVFRANKVCEPFCGQNWVDLAFECTTNLKQGCVCIPGYIRNPADKSCVLSEDCPGARKD